MQLNKSQKSSKVKTLFHVLLVVNAKASECLKCGLCEQICPQHLHIRDLLVEVAEAFEKK